MLRPWRRLRANRLQRCRVFDVDEVRFEPPHGGRAETFYCIQAPDWINVIPLTADGQVLFLRQFRFGVDDFTLEIPGGMCDPGETPLQAAQRELREETGYVAGKWNLLGWVHPNPALQNNRCYSYVARDLRREGEPRPDAHEEFELQQVPRDRVASLIATGEVTHSLVVAAFHLLDVGQAPSAGERAGQ